MNKANFLLLQTSKGEAYISYDTIVRVEALSNYSKIYFDNGKVLVVSKVLQWLEEKLSNDCFIRVHRSHLVNYAHIETFDLDAMKLLVLKDNSRVEVSRRKKIEVGKKLKRLIAA